MNDRPAPTPPPVVEAIFDRTPQPFADGPPDPIVYDASARALRQRTVNFAAKRFADMMFVSGLDRATAERHFRWRAVTPPAGLGAPRCRCRIGQAALDRGAARRPSPHRDATRRPPRQPCIWNDPAFRPGDRRRHRARPVTAASCSATHAVPMFDPTPIARADGAGRAWPHGEAVERHPPAPAALDAALDAFFAESSGALRHPDRHAGARAAGTLQRLRRPRSRDAELVDDQGDHLHRDRADDP